LITIRLGFVIIYLNQSSERNMIDIPGCSERTNFKTAYCAVAEVKDTSNSRCVSDITLYIVLIIKLVTTDTMYFDTYDMV
jgi:hypothetical protein